MFNMDAPRFNQIEAVHYLVSEYYPEDIPLKYRAAAAITFVEDIFDTPCPRYLPPGDHPTVSEDCLVEIVSDYAWRKLTEDEWVLVYIFNEAPEFILTPSA